MVSFGLVLVGTSHHKLGFYGTYMGDHCGIFLKERIRSFPFDMFENPMYLGSTSNMVGTGLFFKSPVGIFLGFFAMTVYYFFVQFHEE